MKETRGRVQALLARGDFPGEILTGVPVVEIRGDREVMILCHRGVLAYEERMVQVASALGPVTIHGEGRVIFRMNRERIILQGRVTRVELGESSC